MEKPYYTTLADSSRWIELKEGGGRSKDLYMMFGVEPGTLWPLWYPPDFDPTRNWVHQCYQQPRTLRQWESYLESMSQRPFQSMAGFTFAMGPDPSPIPNIWTERPRAAEMLRDWLAKSACTRWILRKWIQKVQVRICKKRRIGADSDIYTMEPVPSGQLVEVIDFPTRSTYVFHTYTAHRLLVEDILFQQYAISEPRFPRNPYINLPWSIGQVCSLVDQIQTNMWKRHQFVCQSVQLFRSTRYDLSILMKSNSSYIRLVSARGFFRNTAGVGWESVYSETIDALLDDYEVDYSFSNIHRTRLKQRLLERRLPVSIMKIWDEYVLAYWMYWNYKTFLEHTGGSIDTMMIRINLLYQETIEHLKQNLHKA